MTEVADLKVEYGKDLGRLTRLHEARMGEKDQKYGAKLREEEEEQRKKFEIKEQELKDDININEQKRKDEIKNASHEVREAQRELKKLKNERTGYFNGGWGTFIICFEDKKILNEDVENYNKGKTVTKKDKNTNEPKRESKNDKKTDKKSKKKGKGDHQRTSSRSSKSGSDRGGSTIGPNDKNMDHPHPIEKISHFVEVGFLLDRNNFRLIDTLEEKTFDSNMKKYLYELQDPINNYQMNDLEFKIKQQLMENVGIF